MKIRFVKVKDKWLIQRKTWLRWKYIGYWRGGFGGDYWQEVCEFSQEEALESALKILKLRRDTTKITQFPTICIY